MDMNSILVIVGIVVLLGVAGGCLFGVMKLRGLMTTLDTKVDPKLDEIKKITAGLVPAVGQAEDILKQVNVTMDALDTTVVDIDGKLAGLKRITGTVIAAGETGSNTVQHAKSTVKGKVKGIIGRLR